MDESEKANWGVRMGSSLFLHPPPNFIKTQCDGSEWSRKSNLAWYGIQKWGAT